MCEAPGVVKHPFTHKDVCNLLTAIALGRRRNPEDKYGVVHPLVP